MGVCSAKTTDPSDGWNSNRNDDRGDPYNQYGQQRGGNQYGGHQRGSGGGYNQSREGQYASSHRSGSQRAGYQSDTRSGYGHGGQMERTGSGRGGRGGSGGRQQYGGNYPDPVRNSPRQRQTFKLLFLGAGESGKSTLFKRMKIRFGRGFVAEELKKFLPIIYENTIQPMKILIRQSENLPLEFDCRMREENYDFAQFILDLPEEELILDREICECISILWEDPGIQNTFNNRAKFQLQDSADYFFEHCLRAADPKYIPNEMDVLKCRDRTTGILEQNIEYDGNNFQVFDVGGQRAERKKWINCFKNVKAVLFVVAISEFDQLCFEDDETNRLTEALSVFDNVCNSKWFEDTPIVLLLNKKDLFKTKILTNKVKLSTWFDDFRGPDGDYLAACEFIKQKFKAKNKTKKKIFCHFVCATGEEDAVGSVFQSMDDIVRPQPQTTMY